MLEKALKPFVEYADRYADWLRKAIAPNPHTSTSKPPAPP